MSKYKYRLVKNNKWRFELLPGNNNNQYVAKSSEYETEAQALEGINKLQMFLFDKKHNDIVVNRTNLGDDKNHSRYGANFKFSDLGETVYTRNYYSKYQPQKGIERIFENFNTNIRNDLKKIL